MAPFPVGPHRRVRLGLKKVSTSQNSFSLHLPALPTSGHGLGLNADLIIAPLHCRRLVLDSSQFVGRTCTLLTTFQPWFRSPENMKEVIEECRHEVSGH